jgi:hypothetical protein
MQFVPRAKPVPAAGGVESATTLDMKMLAAVTALCVATAVVSASYTQKYRSRVSLIDRTTDFSKLKTYAWLESHLVADAELDAQIVAAVDHEFGALGMAKVAPASADVVVTYAAYSRTDVRFKAPEVTKDVRPSYAVGTLVVSVLAPQYMKPLLELRADTPVERASRATKVVETVSEMFQLYPRRRH